MNTGNDLPYPSVMYYTAAALLLLAAMFCALSGNFAMAALWPILGIAICLPNRFFEEAALAERAAKSRHVPFSRPRIRPFGHLP
jgi:hypothetical protein